MCILIERILDLKQQSHLQHNCFECDEHRKVDSHNQIQANSLFPKWNSGASKMKPEEKCERLSLSQSMPKYEKHMPREFQKNFNHDAKSCFLWEILPFAACVESTLVRIGKSSSSDSERSTFRPALLSIQCIVYTTYTVYILSVSTLHNIQIH